jgi:hypothetical protein
MIPPVGVVVGLLPCLMRDHDTIILDAHNVPSEAGEVRQL